MQRPHCNSCKNYVDEVLSTVKAHTEELQQLNQRIAQLKQKNSEDKRRHSEINNQIIMSNVKYQQALNQAHAMIQRYIREREDYIQKEIIAASQQGELESLKIINAKILDLLARSLEDNHQPSKPTKATVSQLRNENSRSAMKGPWVSVSNEPRPPTAKGLHMRTDSESNSGTYLAAVTKQIKPKPIPKPSNPPASKPTKITSTKSSKVESDENNITDNNLNDSNMSIEYEAHEEATIVEKPADKNLKNNRSPTTDISNLFFPSKETLAPKRKERNSIKPTTQTENLEESEKKGELETLATRSQEDLVEGRKYGLRRSISKNYAEPSLNTKMRRGDTHPNIIPEYVVRSYAVPIRTGSEDSPPDD